MRAQTALLFGFAAYLLIGTAQGSSREDAQVLASKDMAPDVQGQIERIKLLRTKRRHPLVRRVERIVSDPATGATRGVSSVEMIGDHVIVEMRPDANRQQADALCERLGGKIIGRIPRRNVYLVELRFKDIDAVPAAIAEFRKDAAVKRVYPNHLAGGESMIPNDDYFDQLWGLNNIGQVQGNQQDHTGVTKLSGNGFFGVRIPVVVVS